MIGEKILICGNCHWQLTIPVVKEGTIYTLKYNANAGSFQCPICGSFNPVKKSTIVEERALEAV